MLAASCQRLSALAAETVNAADDESPAPIGRLVQWRAPLPGGAARSTRNSRTTPTSNRSTSSAWRVDLDLLDLSSVRHERPASAAARAIAVRRSMPPADRAAVIIGVLADQIDSPRRRRDDAGPGGKAGGKQRSCEPCRRQTIHAGRLFSGGNVGHCVRRLGIVACLVMPSGLSPSCPARCARRCGPSGAGRRPATFDRRFRNGEREGYGADLSSPALGSDRIPLGRRGCTIGRIIGNAGYRLNLGALTTDALGSVGMVHWAWAWASPTTSPFSDAFRWCTPGPEGDGPESSGAEGASTLGRLFRLPFFQDFDARPRDTHRSWRPATMTQTPPPGPSPKQRSPMPRPSAPTFRISGRSRHRVTRSSHAGSAAGAAMLARVAALQTTLASDLGCTRLYARS